MKTQIYTMKNPAPGKNQVTVYKHGPFVSKHAPTHDQHTPTVCTSELAYITLYRIDLDLVKNKLTTPPI